MGDLDYNVIDIFLRRAEGARKFLLKMVFSKGKTLGKGVQNRENFRACGGPKNSKYVMGLWSGSRTTENPPLVKSDFDYKGGVYNKHSY